VDYRVLVLALRLLLSSFMALMSGLLLWVTGAVTLVPLTSHDEAAITANLVIGAGLGAGLAGWFFGLRIGSHRGIGRYQLPVTIGTALTCAWLGQLFLANLVYANVQGIGVKTTNEVCGAFTGAVIGAMAVPLALGFWRVLRREEP